MFVKCFAGAIVGIKAVKVDVEVNVAGGGIGLYLVGLPDNAVKESEQRIRSAFERRVLASTYLLRWEFLPQPNRCLILDLPTRCLWASSRSMAQ